MRQANSGGNSAANPGICASSPANSSSARAIHRPAPPRRQQFEFKLDRHAGDPLRRPREHRDRAEGLQEDRLSASRSSPDAGRPSRNARTWSARLSSLGANHDATISSSVCLPLHISRIVAAVSRFNCIEPFGDTSLCSLPRGAWLPADAHKRDELCAGGRCLHPSCPGSGAPARVADALGELPALKNRPAVAVSHASYRADVA